MGPQPAAPKEPPHQPADQGKEAKGDAKSVEEWEVPEQIANQEDLQKHHAVKETILRRDAACENFDTVCTLIQVGKRRNG